MRTIRQILWLIQFLTSIPIGFKQHMGPEDLGRSLAYAPLVGLLLGAILAGSFYLLQFLFPVSISALFLCIIYIVLTGGLHLDGLGDTADGLLSHRPKERVLEIMKDSRVGTNAVLAISLTIIGYVLFIAQLSIRNLELIVLMPVIGRMALPIAAGIEKYARPDGLGRHFVNFCGIKELITGIVFSGVIFFSALGAKGLIIVLLTVIFILAIVKLIARKIEGITGDILGAICELTQIFYLILAYLFWVRFPNIL